MRLTWWMSPPAFLHLAQDAIEEPLGRIHEEPQALAGRRRLPVEGHGLDLQDPGHGSEARAQRRRGAQPQVEDRGRRAGWP